MRRSVATGCCRASRVYRPGLQLVLEVVDLLVRLDDGLGQLEVGVEDRGRGASDGRPDQPGHLHQTVTDRIKFLVVRVPHQDSLSYVRFGGSKTASRPPPCPHAYTFRPVRVRFRHPK